MGQALRKATGWRKAPSALKRSMPEGQKPVEGRFEGDPRSQGRAPVEVYPTRPEPQPIIEPGENLRDWDRSDPKYSVMVQKIVGNVITKPGGKQESGEGTVLRGVKRPKPSNRHSTVGTGPNEDSIAAPGTLNVAHIRQVFLSYQGLAEGQDKPMDAKALAERYKVDAALLERVLHFNALPERKNEFAASTKEAGSKSLED